jgi:hypothetical protein
VECACSSFFCSRSCRWDRSPSLLISSPYFCRLIVQSIPPFLVGFLLGHFKICPDAAFECHRLTPELRGGPEPQAEGPSP